VEDYWNLVCRSQLLGEFLAFKNQCAKEKPSIQVVHLIGSGTAERLDGDGTGYGVSAFERRCVTLYKISLFCNFQLMKSKTFQTQMVHLVNQDVKEVSQLVLSPLYPRDKVSRKGSLFLVNL
jgi:hypothetical protein